MTTPLFLLRCLQIGLSLRDLDAHIAELHTIERVTVKKQVVQIYIGTALKIMKTKKENNAKKLQKNVRTLLF